MPEHFSPSQVASMIGKSPSTVRRLASQYADYLTDGANPPAKEPRRYTREDVAVLHVVNQALSQGMKEEDILVKLESVALPSELPALTTVAPMAAQESHQTPHALIAVLDTMAEHIDARTALESRLQATEAQRERLTQLVYIALTVAGVALLVTIITLAAVLFR